MVNALAKGTTVMKCNLRECPGHYQEKLIVETHITRDGRLVVVADIPALVCDVCGDSLIGPGVLDAIRKAIEKAGESAEFAPVVRLPQKVA